MARITPIFLCDHCHHSWRGQADNLPVRYCPACGFYYGYDNEVIVNGEGVEEPRAPSRIHSDGSDSSDVWTD